MTRPQMQKRARLSHSVARTSRYPRVPLDTLLSSLRSGGRDFERVCKWAPENVPEYRQRLRQVWLWDEWPGHWGRDALRQPTFSMISTSSSRR